MTNKEATNKLKRLILELELLEDEEFDADRKENIKEARKLLNDVGVQSYENYGR